MTLFDFSKSPVLKFFGFYKEKPVEVEVPKPIYANSVTITFSETDFRILDALKILTTNWDEKKDSTNTSLSGEYKRHQVYAKIWKMFPMEDKKKLALFIELVISELV